MRKRKRVRRIKKRGRRKSRLLVQYSPELSFVILWIIGAGTIN